MRKIFKSFVMFLLTACMILPFAACGESTGEDPTKTTLYISNFNGGVGSDWLEAAEKEFETMYADVSFQEGRTGVDIRILKNKENGLSLINDLAKKTGEVFFTEQVNYYDFVREGLFEEITDIMTEPNVSKKTDANGVIDITDMNPGVYTVTVPKHPNPPNGTRGVVLKLDPEKVAGKAIRYRAEMRWRGIGSDTTGPHIGGKILGTYHNTAGVGSWTASPSLVGTEEKWQAVSYFCQYPRALKSASITFGIQQGWGMLEFRNPTMEILPATKPFPVPADFVCEYSPAVKELAGRRGVMSPIPEKITVQDIHDLGGWGANLLRYQIVGGLRNNGRDIAEYEKWIDRALDKLDTLMPALREHDIRVIIDMHFPPGGRYSRGGVLGTAGAEAADAFGNKARFLMMEEPEYRQAFLDTWKRIAARYKDNPVIYGYDLVNEPDQRGPAKFDYWTLQFDAAKAIRAIDPETPIIVESNNWCSPLTYDEFSPMPLKNIIYQVHMYKPGTYTHQRVKIQAGKVQIGREAITYPGKIGGLHYDREMLRQELAPVRDFQKKYGARIYVGEFSAAVWAPGAADYLRDLIEIFEEYGWDWSYHAFRESPVWDVEMTGTDRNNLRPAADTDRKRVLLDAFRKNHRPAVE